MSINLEDVMKPGTLRDRLARVVSPLHHRPPRAEVTPVAQVLSLLLVAGAALSWPSVAAAQPLTPRLVVFEGFYNPG